MEREVLSPPLDGGGWVGVNKMGYFDIFFWIIVLFYLKILGWAVQGSTFRVEKP
jgi:hypothetical protein